ncbi:hypothetical protein FB567DRAFT_554351 [Paraphoma chrysanthemicola]|uniref:Uncharacterized protein n=1 Tax=Paraphoma chrysanthemicola TaxID=798071 RepID=A0A8K0QTS5_9PLEO|nr:hypothetical protein FB567DRAFT_554351 [Paraphoma chrysanthemicola]
MPMIKSWSSVSGSAKVFISLDCFYRASVGQREWMPGGGVLALAEVKDKQPATPPQYFFSPPPPNSSLNPIRNCMLPASHLSNAYKLDVEMSATAAPSSAVDPESLPADTPTPSSAVEAAKVSISLVAATQANDSIGRTLRPGRTVTVIWKHDSKRPIAKAYREYLSEEGLDRDLVFKAQLRLQPNASREEFFDQRTEAGRGGRVDKKGETEE